jgi:ATP-binding cassette subfamily F protein uup
VKKERKERFKARPAGPRKLTFKETRELEELPGRIEALEQEQRQLYEAMADESFYRDDGKAAARSGARLGELELLLQEAYGRWEELESVHEKYSKSKGVRSEELEVKHVAQGAGRKANGSRGQEGKGIK